MPGRAERHPSDHRQERGATHYRSVEPRRPVRQLAVPFSYSPKGLKQPRRTSDLHRTPMSLKTALRSVSASARNDREIVRAPSASCKAGVPEPQRDNHDGAGPVVPCVDRLHTWIEPPRPVTRLISGWKHGHLGPALGPHRCHVRAKELRLQCAGAENFNPDLERARPWRLSMEAWTTTF
jgi:hypothetical protein